MGQIKRTVGKKGNCFATIYQPINSELYPPGREAAGSNTIYTFSCSLENGPSEQAKTLKDHWRAVRQLLTTPSLPGSVSNTPLVIPAHLIPVPHNDVLNSDITFKEIS